MKKIFRDAEWLNRERVMLWAKCFGAAWVLFIFYDVWAHSTHGITDKAGEPAGRDFIVFWAGAMMATAGKAAAAYEVKAFHDFLRSLVGHETHYNMYAYPPIATMFIVPLTLLPFLPGYFLWSAAGYALCVKVLSWKIPWRTAAIAAIAAPACFINIVSGQNGFFSAALLAGGLMLLERRPAVAGVLFGLLCYKPQLGLLIPLALAAGGYWRSFIAASVTVLCLAGIATLIFGIDIWLPFVTQSGRYAMLMESFVNFWHRMPTVFPMMRMAGLGVTLSYVAQAVSAVAALYALFKAWRGKAPLQIKSAVLVLAVFLVVPFAGDYDMVVLLFALVWVADDARVTGWLPWEKMAWLFLILLPFHMLPMSKLLGIQLGAAFIWAVLALTLKRVSLPRTNG